MSIHIDTLRRAATRLREMAEAAAPGPWTMSPMGPFVGLDFTLPRAAVQPDVCTASPADATLIATFGPEAALLLADWLEECATEAEGIGRKYARALALARHILGTSEASRIDPEPGRTRAHSPSGYPSEGPGLEGAQNGAGEIGGAS